MHQTPPSPIQSVTEPARSVSPQRRIDKFPSKEEMTEGVELIQLRKKQIPKFKLQKIAELP